MATGPVLVVDFGAQYAQLIARRVREANVYSELVPHSMPVDEMLAKDPQAIILSGGPASVFEPGAPRVDKKLFEAGVPVLGICYGFQAMAYALGADVDKAALGEYGKTETTIDEAEGLLEGSPAEQNTWMSHGVAVKTAPEGFEVLAHTEGAPVAAMQDESRRLYGVQRHPEVKHTPMGQQLIETFLHKCAGLPNNWDASGIIEYIRPSAISSPACSLITVCCVRARPSRSGTISSRPRVSSSSRLTLPRTSSPR